MASNLTTIKIYFGNYYRPQSNFNPTIYSEDFKDVLASPYDYDKIIRLGLLDPLASSLEKFKFTPFNSSLTLKLIKFKEVTYRDSPINALVFPYYSPFKWITMTSCEFYLRQQLIMTLQGVNVNVTSCYFNITLQNRITQYTSMAVCSLY